MDDLQNIQDHIYVIRGQRVIFDIVTQEVKNPRCPLVV